MMKVMIRETGKIEELSYVAVNGTDCIQDFVGNTGALSDGQFSYDDEQDVYVADQDTYDWWAKVVSDNVALDDRIADLSEIHGNSVVRDVVSGAGDVDLEDYAGAVNHALNEAFGN